MGEVVYIDIRPSQAYHGTGMITEGEYDITDAKFGAWDYNGTQPVAVPALGVEFKSGDEAHVQWYSAGDMKNLRPSADGKRLQQAEGASATALNDQCNCFQFLTALVRAGFDEEVLLKDVSSMVGLRVTVVHEPTVEREIRGTKKKAGTLAVVGKILSKPDEKGTPKKAATAAAKKANGQEGAGLGADAGITAKTTQALVSALKETTGHALEKKELTAAMWKRIPGNDADRSKIMNLIIQDSYLGSLVDQGILYDDKNAQVMYVGD
jgi:hypothetical protein